MSARLGEIVSLLAASAVLVFVSCSDKVSDAQWTKTIPGFYDGNQAGFRETLDLDPKGTFQHEVYLNGKSALNETGKWSFDVQSGIVLVEPFTSFFNKDTRKIMTQGVSRSQDTFGVMRYGTAAEKISQSVDFEYVLVKKTPPSMSGTNGLSRSNSVSAQSKENIPDGK